MSEHPSPARPVLTNSARSYQRCPDSLMCDRRFAREVRKSVGFQLDRDAHEAKRHAQSVKDEMQGFYSDDDEAGSSDME